MNFQRMKNTTNFKTEVYEPLDALCTNKERTKVAVVGRTVTKVFSICEDRFELQADRSKPRKTMYFSGSIAWSPLKDNLLAVTSSNGAIYTWDPESSQTMEVSYKAHKQLATKVCFSEFNENLLVSGSKDSTIWLYDLRSAQPSQCFTSNQDDSIRDIQFCMESKLQDTFVSASDSGSIRFWDIRKPDKPMKEFIAHSSQVYSLALNPQIQSKNLIATAGRDKYIRIWDWSKNTPQFLYTVEMMAIVTRVSWCPNNSWHVACCFAPPSGFVSSDNTIYVWDIRRPYIPFASFDSHTKTCTDMSWPNYNGNSFLSCGKDGKLIMNFTDNAQHPILYANSVAITTSCSSNDELIVSVPSYRRKTSSSTTTLIDQSADPFRRKVPSVIFNASPTDPFLLDHKVIAYFGQNYKINGKLISELCEHNAIVAENILKDRIAYVWRMIGEMVKNSKMDLMRPEFASNSLKYDSLHKHGEVHGEQKNESGDSKSGDPSGKWKKGGGNEIEFDSTAPPTAMLISGGSLTVHNPFSTNLDLFFGMDELNLGGMENGDSEEKMLYKSRRSVVFASGILNLSELNEEAFDSTNKRIAQKTTLNNSKRNKLNSKIIDFDGIMNFNNNGQFYEKELMDQDEILMDKMEMENLSPSNSSSENQVEMEEFEGEQQMETAPKMHSHHSADGNNSSNLKPQKDSQKFDSLPSLRSLLTFFSNLGDIQMCSTICLILGEKIVEHKLANPEQIDLWFHMYIELLERLKLWRISSLMVKACSRPKINQLSNESTFVKVFCPNCRNLSTRATLRCQKCREFYNYTCTICETTVRGIWTSCNECGHGGHIFHVEEWFNQFKICPAIGCGHHCNGMHRNIHIFNT